MICLVLFPLITAVIYIIVARSVDGVSARRRDQPGEGPAGRLHQDRGRVVLPATEIAQAKQLLDSGAITQAEFDSLKARVLS